jgi:diguanylate cyclase (GGDEF)-like protein
VVNKWPPDIDLVAGIAGDRRLSTREKANVARIRKQRGKRYYADLLFSVSQQYYPDDIAEDLWRSVLRHKADLAEHLKRNVGIVVAAIDYLSNIREVLDNPTAVPERHLVTIAEVALRDGLTGLYDHETFWHKLRDEFRRFSRYGYEVSVVMLDLDHFKHVNDAHGHAEGDRMLIEVARIIQTELREVDVGARYGGEEMVMILPNTQASEAKLVAERVRTHVERRFQHEAGLTVSLGVADCPSHARAPEALVEAADRALYRSKRDGRNRTTVSGSTMPHKPGRK